MQWLRVHATLLTNQRYTGVSATARAVYDGLLMLAAVENCDDGRLVGPLRPFGISDFVTRLTLAESEVQSSIPELITVGLIDQNHGVFQIIKFEDKGSIIRSSTSRVQEHRERAQRNTDPQRSNETLHETFQRNTDPQRSNETYAPDVPTYGRTDVRTYARTGELEQAQAALEPPRSPPKRQPRQTTLTSPHETRARDILAMLWPRVQSAVGRAMTQKAWKQRNKRDALDLAAVERSDEDLLAALQSASKRTGSSVYRLAIIADELVRLDNPSAQPARNGNGGRLGPYDGDPVTPRREEMR